MKLILIFNKSFIFKIDSVYFRTSFFALMYYIFLIDIINPTESILNFSNTLDFNVIFVLYPT